MVGGADEQSPLEWMIARFTAWVDRRARKGAPVTPVDSALFASPLADAVERLLDREHLERHPPACLSGLSLRLVSAANDGGGDWIVRWEIGCACGGRAGALLGHPLSAVAPERVEAGEHDPLLGPLTFACEACGKDSPVLDTDRHGWHAAIASSEGGAGSAKLAGAGRGTVHACPTCRGTMFALTAELAYWDVEESAEAAVDMDLAPADLFNGFELDCRCEGCGQVSRPTDFGKL